MKKRFLKDRKIVVLSCLITTTIGIGLVIECVQSINSNKLKTKDINKIVEMLQIPIENNESIIKELQGNKIRLAQEEERKIVEKQLAEEEAQRLAEQQAMEKEKQILAEEEEKRKIEEYNNYHYNNNGLKIDITPVVETNPNKKYWIVDVETSNPNALMYELANDTWGGVRETTSSIAKRHNAILAINASGFSYETGEPKRGVYVKNGVINRDEKSTIRTMAIDSNGAMRMPEVGTTAQDLINQGIKYTLEFGPTLINNGGKVPITNNKYFEYQPRTAIGQRGSNQYTIIVADGRSSSSIGLSCSDLQDILLSKGCFYGYNLDGGGSSSLYFKGRLVNNPSDGTERPVADILYFK